MIISMSSPALQTLFNHISRSNCLINACRPVFNLSFISKLTERIVMSRINESLASNSFVDPYQSDFTKPHSTKTLLTSMYNKLVSAISHQQVSCLYLLDISAAIDTIGHNVLLKGLTVCLARFY